MSIPVEADGARRLDVGLSGRVLQLGMACLGLTASATVSLMVPNYIMGRANPLQATRSWLAILALVFLALAWQQVAFARRLSRLPAKKQAMTARHAYLPIGAVLALAASVDATIYLSDGFYFHVLSEWTVRTALALLMAGFIVALFEIPAAYLEHYCGGIPVLQVLQSQVRARTPRLLLVITAVVGLLEATCYVSAMGDDYARYWTIADALSGGWGYPASEVGGVYLIGGMNSYLVDLPALPLAMMASFALLGHTVLAAMAPALVVTAFFPLAAYLAFRELTGHTVVSFAGALALALFPLLTFYVVRSAEPDGIFITLLMGMAFLAIRNDRHPRQRLMWVALGLTTGIVALTRPEGIMFAGTTFLTLALRHIRRWGFWLGGGVSALMLAAFSTVMLLSFGTPWPTSFMGTVQLENISQNLEGFVIWSLPRYSLSLGVPVPGLALGGALVTMLYIVGAWQLARRKPQLLFLALLPAMSMVAFLLVSPWLTRPPFPYDFFRRASYGLPFLTLVAAYPVALALRRGMAPGIEAEPQGGRVCCQDEVLAVLHPGGTVGGHDLLRDQDRSDAGIDLSRRDTDPYLGELPADDRPARAPLRPSQDDLRAEAGCPAGGRFL